MNAPTDFPSRSAAGANSTSLRWAALLEAGKVVCAMAGMAAEQPSRQVRAFPVLVRDCPRWKRELADNGVADLAAVMEPGIAALLAINARGADPRPAARAVAGVRDRAQRDSGPAACGHRTGAAPQRLIAVLRAQPCC